MHCYYEKFTDQACKPNILEHVNHFSKIILFLLSCVIIHGIFGNQTSYTNDNNYSAEINIYSDKISATSRYAYQIASKPKIYNKTKDVSIYDLDSPTHFSHGCLAIADNHLIRKYQANQILVACHSNFQMTSIEKCMNTIECKQSYCRNPMDNTSKIVNNLHKFIQLTQFSSLLHIYLNILFNLFRPVTYESNQALFYCVLPPILILLQSFQKKCFIQVLSINRKSSINHNHQKNKNNAHLILLILLMFIVSNDFYAVSGDEFYVGTTGSNANSCTQISQPCLTLDTPTALRGTVDSSTEYTVFIMDKTTLSMPFTISSTQTLPRTFTNNPQSSSIQSVIEIAHFDGYFEIYGNSLFDHINFTLSNVVSNSHGGIINVNIGEPSRTLEISNCNFIGFKTSTTGGALGLSINNYAHATLKNLLFEGCEANIAGAVFITIAAGGQVTVSESCTFTECKITQNNANGGGIYAIISGQYSKLIFKDSVTFDKCSGLTGSGISLLMYNFGQLTIEDSCSCSFIDCDSTATGGTGTFYIEASGPNYEINLLGEMIFERCNSDEYGGGLFIGASYAGQITINEMSFIDCNSAMYGGGFFSKFESGTQMTISGIITYDKCHCTGRVGSSASYGGGQYIEAGQDCKINVTGELEYKECEAHQGGGLHIEIFNKATVELNKATFTDSKSRLDGGGLFLYVLLEAQFTIYGTASFINCNSSTFGGAIRFRNDGGIINVDPTEQILIENCNSINNGSGIYCSITNKGQTQINYIKFSKCKSLSGGGIFARINLEGQLILSKSYEFDQCESIQDGGGIITTLQSGGQMTVSGPCSFTDCKAISDGTGGGIYATVNGENCQFIFEDSVTFDGCQALYKGGGIYLDIYNGGLFTLSGPSSFTDCTAQNVSGGGCCINAYQPKYEINLQGKMQFERCSSKNGGGLFIDCQFAGQFTIKNISFTGCNCTNQGGALFSYLRYGAKITITGKVEFDDCHNINGFGGGQYLLVIGLASQILITGELVYKQCEAKLGGGLFVSSQNKAIIGINKASFKNCYSQENGGGIYASVETEGQLSFDNSFEFYQCESGYDGGGIYNYLGQGGQMTISGPCLFTECRAISTTFWGYGGGIYAKIEGQNSSFSVEDSMTFDRCQAFICGGGMRLDIGGLSKFSMFGSVSFTDCTAQNAYGGGYYINALDPDYEINLQGKMQFERCRSDEYGGGLFIDCHLAGQITIKDISFTGCNSTSQGGALFSGLSSGVQMTITGKVAFDKCNSNNQGGGQYQELAGLGSLIRITGELEYKECASIFGGGLCIIVEDRSTVEINKASFIDCLSGYAGGGLFLQARTGGQFTITGTASFTDCNSSSVGGGIYLETNNGTVNFNPTEQILIDNCNSLQDGGGIYCWINNQGQVQINNIKFSRCKSLSGGGIYASIQSGGQLILDKSCELYQCKSNGNGGGIYINIDFSTQCSFLIKDAFIHDCKALINNSLSYSQTGFGGGLFLGGSGDYSPISKLIDLHGMNITNNSADKYGQSLFVAMTKIVEFCKYGILGEYVKGNYSDTYSDENDLEGIPMNLTEFNTSTLETIEQKQQPLEPWWRILGILRSAQVIVNVSNPNGKLIFNLEGQSMIPGYLNVKIFELRDKTQEEIDQEQKEMNYIFNNNNFITVKQISYQSKFTQKHQTINQQQISINSNIKIKKKLHNNANEIIYPPEDGSISPISIEGEIPNDQKATFGINDYKWLNYKEKVYGTLISNDRNIFTGKDGHDIEEDENAAVQLEVIIEEEVEDDESEIDDPEKEDDDKKDDSQKEDDPEEQGEKDGKGKGLQVGAIIGIVFGILAFITLIVIIIIIVVVSEKKNEKENKQQNNEQQLSDLSTIVEPSKSSASNNQMSQIKTPPLSKVNSQIKSFDITNSQVRSYDITNASDQQSNISNPKVQQTFISNSQVHPNNSTISKAQPSIKPVSKVQSYYIPNSRVKMPNNLVKQQSISQTRLPPLNQQQSLVRTPPLNQQQSLVRTPPLNQQQSLDRTPPLNQQQSLDRTPPLNQQQSLVRTPPLNQQQSLVRTPPLNQQQSLNRTPPLNQQQSLVRTPPLNQQQSLVRTPPLSQQQSLNRLSPLNDNIVLHQRDNGNLKTNNRVISRGVVSRKKSDDFNFQQKK